MMSLDFLRRNEARERAEQSRLLAKWECETPPPEPPSDVEGAMRRVGLDPDGPTAAELRAFESFLRAHAPPRRGIRQEWLAYASGETTGADVDWRDYHGFEGDDS